MEREVIQGLMARGIPQHIAIGIAANMIAESGLNPGINEIAPIVPGSRGGYGLNQWTGPRRRAYEAFAGERGAALDDLNAQLDFTLYELNGPEARAWQAIQQAKDPTEAARLYSELFLRPGIPNMDKRLKEAARLAGGEYQPNTLAPRENAFAMQTKAPEPYQPKTNLLDPSAFMVAAQQFNTLGRV